MATTTKKHSKKYQFTLLQIKTRLIRGLNSKIEDLKSEIEQIEDSKDEIVDAETREELEIIINDLGSQKYIEPSSARRNLYSKVLKKSTISLTN